MNAVDDLLNGALGKLYTAAAAEVRYQGATVFKKVYGTVDLEGDLANGQPVDQRTVFDYASLTKLFTTTAFFRLVDAGHVTLDTLVKDILPDFDGQRQIAPYPDPLKPGSTVEVVSPTRETVDAGQVRFRHLLTHSSGLPAWLDLRQANSVEERLKMCLNTHFSYPTGSQVVYSDIGFILLGMTIAKLTDQPLNVAMQRLIIKPLDLALRYGPISDGNVPPTEFDMWRGRRVKGEVHDENSATLNGIAGHAGLFGLTSDCATLAQLYLADGGGFITPRLAKEATRTHIGDRGLGWMMRSDESSSGQYFSPDSYGHTGFVGNSLWVDPQRKLICVLLTNNVFFGRGKEGLYEFRRNFHDTVINTLGLRE